MCGSASRLIKHQRYAHAKQFKRANNALRKLKTYLGRTIRDISRQIAGEDEDRDDLQMPALTGIDGSGAETAPAPQDLQYSLHAPNS